MSTAVVTVVAGRHDHLARQERALAAGTAAPDVRVVVSMGDPQVAAVVDPGTEVVDVAPVDGRLPLAAARNAGVRRAVERGADALVLLDVDCLPAPGTVGRYAELVAARGGLLCGPVGYLPPAPPGGYPLTGLDALARPHPARPVPAEDEVVDGAPYALFWSLSFATSPADWERVGGFDEAFTGYGGEDTDFGQRAARAGVPMRWAGGAWAFHQHHGPEQPGPPVRHLHDVVRNAGVFFDRWGWWPMEGWLQGFAERGLAHVDPASGRWAVTS